LIPEEDPQPALGPHDTSDPITVRAVPDPSESIKLETVNDHGPGIIEVLGLHELAADVLNDPGTAFIKVPGLHELAADIPAELDGTESWLTQSGHSNYTENQRLPPYTKKQSAPPWSRLYDPSLDSRLYFDESLPISTEDLNPPLFTEEIRVPMDWVPAPQTSPLRCSICTKEFYGCYQKDNLKRHLREKHSLSVDDADKTCRCCERVYMRADAHKKYEWKIHRLETPKPQKRRKELVQAFGNTVTRHEYQIRLSSLTPSKQTGLPPDIVGNCPDLPLVASTQPHELSDCNHRVYTLASNVLECRNIVRSTSAVSHELFPMVDISPLTLNYQPDIVRRSASLPGVTELPPENRALGAAVPRRALSESSVSNPIENHPVLQSLPGALNGVSIFYATTSERFIVNPDGQGVRQLTKALEIHQSCMRKPFRSSSLNELHHSKPAVRTYTVKINPKLLQNLPFANLIRSASLEDANFYQSVQDLHNMRYMMKAKEKQRHHFRAGKLSISARDSVIRKAYPPLKCDQCTRVFTGQHRRRILAGHCKRMHGHAASKSEALGSPRTSDCQTRRSDTRCSRLSRGGTKRVSRPGKGSMGFEHRNRSLRKHSLRDHGCKL